MTMVRYREDEIPELTEAEKAELRALAGHLDREIDYSDIPPLTKDFWQRAVLWKTCRTPTGYAPSLSAAAWLNKN